MVLDFRGLGALATRLSSKRVISKMYQHANNIQQSSQEALTSDNPSRNWPTAEIHHGNHADQMMMVQLGHGTDPRISSYCELLVVHFVLSTPPRREPSTQDYPQLLPSTTESATMKTRSHTQIPLITSGITYCLFRLCPSTFYINRSKALSG